MNTKVEQTGNRQGSDAAKLVLAVVVFLAGVFAYYWFSQLPQVARLGVLIAGIVVAAVIANFTWVGAKARHFFVETRFEVRKIVWPTRDDTIRTTLLVIAVVIILAVLLGLFDLLLKSVILDWLLSV